MFQLNENAFKNKVQTFKEKVWQFYDSLIQTKEEKEANEKRLDQELKDSFPASDPSAHRSKSVEDYDSYH